MDNWEKYQTMSADKLMGEIDRLNNMLFKMDSASPMFTQICNMIDVAQSAYHDKIHIAQLESQKDKPDVIEIGGIDSHVDTPDYSKETLDIVVDSYVQNLRKNK